MFPETKPKKFIVWGLYMYQTTHSYIHYAYHKAALSLGWDCEWVTDTVENSQKYKDCDDYLFLTLGGSEKYIPINNKAFYVLHNCEENNYKDIPLKNKLILQVFTTDVYERKVIKLSGKLFEFWQPDINCLYMPWATDLLPEEIDKNMNNLSSRKISDSKYALFLGSIGGGYFSNINELGLFEQGLKNKNISMRYSTHTNTSQEESINAIKNSDIAPSIVGHWQKEKGYIPCRIFKTISYGKLGVTNSKYAHEVINNLTLYNSDEKELGILAADALENNNYDKMLLDSMKFVRDNHTYLNRIETLLFIFKLKNSM